METFTLNEMENIFELGRIAQTLVRIGAINADSKEIFNVAVDLAIEFEKKYYGTEEYYTDIENFGIERFVECLS